MTDPFDFEPRFEERLVAHAARATRPFDASAIAATATLRSTSPRLPRLLTPSTGRVSVLRVATILLLLVTLLAATLLAGGFFRRPPIQIRPAVVAPYPSPAHLADPTTGPTPTGTPHTSDQPQPPRADRLAVVSYDAGGCGGRLIEIDVATGKLSEPLEGCFDVIGVKEGGRFVVAGGGTRVPTGDGYSISGDQGGATVMNLVTGDAAHLTNLQPSALLAPGGQWALEYGPYGHARVGPIDGSRWVEMPTPAGTGTPSGPAPSSWSPDGAHLAVRTDRGLAVWDGGSSAFHLVDSILGSVWSWSADGQTVASIWGGRVYVADIDGTTVVDVTDFPGGGVGGVWLTPDGKTVVEWKDRSLRVIGPDGDRHTIPLETGRDGRLDLPGRADAGTYRRPRSRPGQHRAHACRDDGRRRWSPRSTRRTSRGRRTAAVSLSGSLHTTSIPSQRRRRSRTPRGRRTSCWSMGRPPASRKQRRRRGRRTAHRSRSSAAPAEEQSIEVVSADGSGRRAVTAKPIKGVDGITWIH